MVKFTWRALLYSLCHDNNFQTPVRPVQDPHTKVTQDDLGLISLQALSVLA